MSQPTPVIRIQPPGGQVRIHELAQGPTVLGRDAQAGLVLDDRRGDLASVVVTAAATPQRRTSSVPASEPWHVPT